MTAVDFYGPLPNSKVATVTQIRGFARGLAASGIYPANYGLYATDFVCSDGGGLDVSVAAGEGLVDGIYATSSSVKTVTLDAADPADDRIDLVVLELDQAAGTVTLEKVTGTPDAAPTAPAVTREFDGTFQWPLAEVPVPAGSAVLGAIVDVREFATMLGAGAPADGDTMVYDAATGLWIPGNASSVTSDSDTVATQEFTTSASYTDLTTSGPAVTVTVGASGKALVLLSCSLYNETSGNYARAGFAASGATTLAAATARAIVNRAGAASMLQRQSIHHEISGMTAGASLTVTAKYQVDGSNGGFGDRYLTVLTW